MNQLFRAPLNPHLIPSITTRTHHITPALLAPSNADPFAPLVLSTSAVLGLTESTTAHALNTALNCSNRHTHCAVSVPRKIELSHFLPTTLGASLRVSVYHQTSKKKHEHDIYADRTFEGERTGKNIRFDVAVFDENERVIAQGVVHRAVVCRENLENEALLALPGSAGEDEIRAPGKDTEGPRIHMIRVSFVTHFPSITGGVSFHGQHMILSPEGSCTLCIMTNTGQENRHAILNLLLSYGLDPNSTDEEDYWAPLHYAINSGGHGAIDTIEFLVKANADPDQGEDEKWTPLHFAVDRGRVDVVRLLLRYGANGGLRTGKGDTAIMLGVRNRKVEVVEAL
ncbi:ankyrin repeat-containing domain protein [Aspergillus crustosus]